MADQSLEARLATLGPEARARVEAALKDAVESTLAAEAAGAQAAVGKEFSKGWFFSRSRPRSMFDEITLVQQAASMDEATFARFAERLRSLRNIREAGSGGGG